MTTRKMRLGSIVYWLVRFLFNMEMTPVALGEKYGTRIELKFKGRNILILSSAKGHDEVQRVKATSFVKKMRLLLEQHLKHGVLVSDGEVHDQARPVVVKYFNGATLRKAEAFVSERVKKMPTNELLSQGGLGDLARDAVSLTVFGEDCEDVGPLLGRIIDSVGGKLGVILGEIPGNPLNKPFTDLMSELVSITEDAILKRKKCPGTDFVSHLLGSGMSDEQVIVQVKTLLFAGSETSAMTLPHIVRMLVRHKTRLYAEVLEYRKLQAENPAQAAKFGFPLFKSGFHETLRKRPPLPVLARTAIEDVNIDGRLVEKGTIVFLNVIHTHYQWPYPYTFQLDRFLKWSPKTPEEKAMWIPFGVPQDDPLGKSRQCPGQNYTYRFMLFFSIAFLEKLSQEEDVK